MADKKTLPPFEEFELRGLKIPIKPTTYDDTEIRELISDTENKLDAEITDRTRADAGMYSSITAAEGRIITLESKVDTEVLDRQSADAALDNRTTANENGIARLDREQVTQNSEISDIDARETALAGRVTAAEEDIDTIEETLESHNKRITANETDIDGIKDGTVKVGAAATADSATTAGSATYANSTTQAENANFVNVAPAGDNVNHPVTFRSGNTAVEGMSNLLNDTDSFTYNPSTNTLSVGVVTLPKGDVQTQIDNIVASGYDDTEVRGLISDNSGAIADIIDGTTTVGKATHATSTNIADSTTRITVYPTWANVNYPVLLRNSTTTAQSDSNALNASNDFKYNPSTSTLTVGAVTLPGGDVQTQIDNIAASGYDDTEVRGLISDNSGAIADIIDGTTTVGNATHASSADTATSATSATNATNATALRTQLASTNVARQVLFLDDGSSDASFPANVKTTVDNDFKYNPSTSTLTVANVAGNASSATYATSAGSATSAASATSATNATNSSNVYVNNASSNNSYPVIFQNDTTTTAGNKAVAHDTNSFTYNPSTNTLTVANLAGNASSATYATSAGSATSATSANSATSATNVYVNNASSNNSYPVIFQNDTTTTTGNKAVAHDTNSFTYNPSTNTLTVANVNGNASSATDATAIYVNKTVLSNNYPVLYQNDVNTSAGYHGVASKNTDFTYNPNTNVFNVPDITLKFNDYELVNPTYGAILSSSHYRSTNTRTLAGDGGWHNLGSFSIVDAPGFYLIFFYASFSGMSGTTGYNAINISLTSAGSTPLTRDAQDRRSITGGVNTLRIILPYIAKNNETMYLNGWSNNSASSLTVATMYTVIRLR